MEEKSLFLNKYSHSVTNSYFRMVIMQVQDITKQ